MFLNKNILFRNIEILLLNRVIVFRNIETMFLNREAMFLNIDFLWRYKTSKNKRGYPLYDYAVSSRIWEKIGYHNAKKPGWCDLTSEQ
jgi:hypothetical protein